MMMRRKRGLLPMTRVAAAGAVAAGSQHPSLQRRAGQAARLTRLPLQHVPTALSRCAQSPHATATSLSPTPVAQARAAPPPARRPSRAMLQRTAMAHGRMYCRRQHLRLRWRPSVRPWHGHLYRRRMRGRMQVMRSTRHDHLQHQHRPQHQAAPCRRSTSRPRLRC